MVIERENIRLIEENEEFKQKYDDIDFKLKLLKEKEKIHENSAINFKEIQRNYEDSIFELKKDFKTKEENLWKKFSDLEEENDMKLRDLDNEYSEKIDILGFQLKEGEKKIEKVKIKIIKQLNKENNYSNEKFNDLDKFVKKKEAEFEELGEIKDKSLKELEKSINIISAEAQSQIYKLTQNVSDLNEKINNFKLRENQLVTENTLFESQILSLDEKIIDQQKKISKLELQNDYSLLGNDVNNHSIEKLKINLREKENYCLKLEKEIEVIIYKLIKEFEE